MLSIVIPYVHIPMLTECLCSLEKSMEGSSHEWSTFLIGPEAGSWPRAINLGIWRAMERFPGCDIVTMDDDIRANPGWAECLHKYYDVADILGFVLTHRGSIVHSGGWAKIPFEGGHYQNRIDKPRMCTHVTASFMVIKDSVLDYITHFEQADGYQYEDVDFSLRAQAAGLKIACLPHENEHLYTATKKQDPAFNHKAAKNWRHFHEKWS